MKIKFFIILIAILNILFAFNLILDNLTYGFMPANRSSQSPPEPRPSGFSGIEPPQVLQEGGLKYMPRDRFAPIQTPQDIVYLIGEILVLLATIFWILAVIASFYAGYLFLFSGGSEEKVGKAKKMFLYAVIAIVIGLMAYALPTLIYNLLDVGSGIWFRIRLRF